jgi:glycosyltransferase involved in cell wall biosynthesis
VVKAFVFAIPGDLDTPTGGYAYDKRMVAELSALGWRIDVMNLGEGFPYPDEDTKRAAETMLAGVPAGRPIVIDGLAFGVLPQIAARLRETHPLIALVHHPLALEAGVAPAGAVMLRESERAALACTRAVIANSPVTARTLAADYGVMPDRITVAPPGTDRPVRVERRAQPAAPVELLSVGALVPRKGYDVLIDALSALGDLHWRLTIAGDCGRSPETAERLKSDISRRALSEKITVEDSVTPARLAALYEQADLFVLASRYEGFGMAYAEAIAYGLPIVGTTAGAIPDTVPPDAGILVRPDDAAGLAAVLSRLINTPEDRVRLAAGSRAAAERLPTWRGSAQLFAAAIEGVA